jgi:uncharacterized protein DUF5666
MLERRAVSMTRTRTIMKTSRVGTKLAALIGALVLFGGVAWAQVSGPVTAISKTRISVAGGTWDITENTVVEDFGHQPITLPEVRVGIPVELEFDEDGGLATIRAAVVR